MLATPTTVERLLCEDDAYQVVRDVLSKNTQWNPKITTPVLQNHNHQAAWLTCAYRMGSSAEQIREIYMSRDGKREPPPDPTHLLPVVTVDNWEANLGHVGLYGIGLHLNFVAYRTFFEKELESKGLERVMQEYMPVLARGICGDFFHSVIEFGYAFESKEPKMVLFALAWMAAAWVEIPAGVSNQARNVVPGSGGPEALLLELSRFDESRFPRFRLDNGGSGYTESMEVLLGNDEYREAVLAFDLDLRDLRLDYARPLLEEICRAAHFSFDAGGAVDFYTLHSVTASRAVWAALSQSGITFDIRVWRTMLSQLWRGIIFTHVARNNARVELAARLSPDAGLDWAKRSAEWQDLHVWALASRNEHVIKVAFTLADFYDRTPDANEKERLLALARKMRTARENGASLEGSGAGDLVEQYHQRFLSNKFFFPDC